MASVSCGQHTLEVRSYNAELEIRIYKCTDITSVHYQFCSDIFKFRSDSVSMG